MFRTSWVPPLSSVSAVVSPASAPTTPIGVKPASKSVRVLAGSGLPQRVAREMPAGARPPPRTHARPGPAYELEAVACDPPEVEVHAERRDVDVPQHRHDRVLLQVSPDTGDVGDDVDPVRAELVGRADAGEHEDFRRRERTGADDHL